MSANVPDDSSTEPQATRIEQCPNCAIVLVRGDKGFYCVVCGFPRSERQPTRQPELADYIERLCHNEGGADAKGLVELAQNLGLRWGSPELTPHRRLKLNSFDSPVLAVQEATGSDKYLVVLCGEASWSTGLVQFFKVEDGKGPSPTRVRLGREAVAQIIGGESLQCLNHGELKVVAPKSKPRRQSTPSPPTHSIAPPRGRNADRPMGDGRGRRRTPTGKKTPEEHASSLAVSANQEVADTVTADDLEIKDYERVQHALKASLPYWGYLLILIIGLLICIYLFRPWISAYTSQVPIMPPEHPVPGEEGNIDLYLMRDASGSPNVHQYNEIEQQILKHVKLDDGDRMSYAQFGGKDDPLDIQTPSKRWESIAAHMGPPSDRRERFTRTDFSNLFDHLRDTISREREERDGRREHIDIVLILTDGVHDPDKTDWRCPKQFRKNGKLFIPNRVRQSLEALVRNSYVRKERLLVAMVIAGEKVDCASDIRSEWGHAKFASLGLNVIPFHELKEDYDIGLSIFKKAKRNRCLYIRPAYARLSDQQRNEFDQLAKLFVSDSQNVSRGFSAQYKYWSHAGGETPATASKTVTVKEALLFPGKKPSNFLDRNGEGESGAIGRLLVVDDEDADPTEARNRARFEFEAPAAGKRQGEIRSRTLHFFFNPFVSLKAKLRPEERYRIKLVLEGASLDVEADELILDKSVATIRRAELKGNLRIVNRFLLGAAIAFCASLFLYMFILPPSSNSDIRTRKLAWLRKALRVIVVTLFKYWIGLFCVLFIILCVSWMVLFHPTSVFVCVIPASVILAALTRRSGVEPESKLPLFLPRRTALAWALEYVLLPALGYLASFISP